MIVLRYKYDLYSCYWINDHLSQRNSFIVYIILKSNKKTHWLNHPCNRHNVFPKKIYFVEKTIAFYKNYDLHWTFSIVSWKSIIHIQYIKSITICIGNQCDANYITLKFINQSIFSKMLFDMCVKKKENEYLLKT